MAGKKKAALRSGNQTRPKPELSAEFKAHIFKPGQSGNPGGRPKKLTEPLEHYLASKDPKGPQYAQLLIEAMVKRAISRSDSMVKEIFDRVEGHVPGNDPAKDAQFGIKVVVVDIPRPPKMIDVRSNGHKPPEDEE